MRRTTARYLMAGDVCVGSGARIHRVVTQGAFMRSANDERTSQRWPKGQVEVLVEYPGSTPRVAYWNASTALAVTRG